MRCGFSEDRDRRGYPTFVLLCFVPCFVFALLCITCSRLVALS
jgi:hypothetical protein